MSYKIHFVARRGGKLADRLVYRGVVAVSRLLQGKLGTRLAARIRLHPYRLLLHRRLQCKDRLSMKSGSKFKYEVSCVAKEGLLPFPAKVGFAELFPDR